jgi:hypothetical protein
MSEDIISYLRLESEARTELDTRHKSMQAKSLEKYRHFATRNPIFFTKPPLLSGHLHK